MFPVGIDWNNVCASVWPGEEGLTDEPQSGQGRARSALQGGRLEMAPKEIAGNSGTYNVAQRRHTGRDVSKRRLTKDSSEKLARQYMLALQDHLTNKNERALHCAYELGRKTMASSLGVIDLARIHQDALLTMLSGITSPGETLRAMENAHAFFRESLSAFEMSHRGFRDANLALNHLNETLECRNRQLAAANSRLQKEISIRKRMEGKLRESEGHYRTLFNRATLMQENLRYMSSQILKVQEEERKRISRELHDEVGQALTAINVNLAVLCKSVRAGRKSMRKRITDAQRLLEETMEAVHNFSRKLRPAMLDDLGLVPALHSFVRNFSQRTGVPIKFSAAEVVEQMEIDQKTVLYRVAQESLTNVARHARASRGSLVIQSVKKGVRMEIADNGCAFSVKQHFSVEKPKRLGLLGMQERVRLAGGEFVVHSRPGQGTRVRVWLPFRISGTA